MKMLSSDLYVDTDEEWYIDAEVAIGINVDVDGNVYVDVHACAEEDTGYRHIDLRASVWLKVLQIQKYSRIWWETGRIGQIDPQILIFIDNFVAIFLRTICCPYVTGNFYWKCRAWKNGMYNS